MNWKAILCILVTIACTMCAMYFGYSSLWVLAIFLTLLLLCAAIMTICSIWTLSFEQMLVQTAVEKGVEAQLAVLCYNKGFFFYPRVELVYRSQDKRKVSVYPGKQKVLMGYAFPRKGTFLVGLEKVVIHDAFGIFCRKIRFREAEVLYVLPRAGEVQDYSQEEVGRISEEGTKKKQVQDRTNISDMREYQYGDMLNSINWKATAKHNEIIVNRYEDEFCSRTFIYVDGRFPLDDIYGKHIILDDYACDLAVTCVKSVLAQEGMVTLFYGGKPHALESNMVKSFQEYGVYLAESPAPISEAGNEERVALERILFQKNVYDRAVFYLRQSTPEIEQLIDLLIRQHIVVEKHQISFSPQTQCPQDVVVKWQEGAGTHA